MTRFFRFAALAAFLALPLAAAAQPASGARDGGERGARHLDRLAERLDLTDAQVAMIKDGMGGERSPGASWDLAARLAPTLSTAQMDLLKTPRLRKQGDRSARDERGQRGEASGQRGEASGERAERRQERAGQREERRAQETAARDAALGLTASQKQALDAARSERQRLPADVADVLTDEQEAVLLVHRALSGPRGRGGRGGKGGQGRRGGRR